MKTIFTFLFCLAFGLATAQDHMFIHTATAANISTNATILDHPDLNGNPNAKIVATHNCNPGGLPGGTLNNNVTGVWYNSSSSKCLIYNEAGSTTPMIEDSSYNVYIAQGDEVIQHIATAANQGSDPAYTVLDHPLLNGADPGPKVVVATNYAGSGYNFHNYGTWFDPAENKRVIYSEDLAPIPLNAAFYVLISGVGTQTYTHEANAGNITSTYTELDHPLLNNKPNAVFVISHYFGYGPDPGNNTIVDKVLGVWYNFIDERWNIYNEDNTPFQPGTAFDIIIWDPSIMGVAQNGIAGLAFSPNPVFEKTTLSAEYPLKSVVLYDALGQELLVLHPASTPFELDLSHFPSGNYFAKVTTGKATETIKLIKQ